MTVSVFVIKDPSVDSDETRSFLTFWIMYAHKRLSVSSDALFCILSIFLCLKCNVKICNFWVASVRAVGLCVKFNIFQNLRYCSYQDLLYILFLCAKFAPSNQYNSSKYLFLFYLFLCWLFSICIPVTYPLTFPLSIQKFTEVKRFFMFTSFNIPYDQNYVLWFPVFCIQVEVY